MTNPFKIGDRVRFTPNDHAVGWSWSSFDSLRLSPGDEGFVTRIESDNYLFLDDERGGFHSECFTTASEIGTGEQSISAISFADVAHETPKRLSAKTTRKDGTELTEAEIEAAEAEAEAWARRVNSC